MNVCSVVYISLLNVSVSSVGEWVSGWERMCRLCAEIGVIYAPLIRSGKMEALKKEKIK